MTDAKWIEIHHVLDVVSLTIFPQQEMSTDQGLYVQALQNCSSTSSHELETRLIMLTALLTDSSIVLILSSTTIHEYHTPSAASTVSICTRFRRKMFLQ